MTLQKALLATVVGVVIFSLCLWFAPMELVYSSSEPDVGATEKIQADRHKTRQDLGLQEVTARPLFHSNRKPPQPVQKVVEAPVQQVRVIKPEVLGVMANRQG